MCCPQNRVYVPNILGQADTIDKMLSCWRNSKMLLPLWIWSPTTHGLPITAYVFLLHVEGNFLVSLFKKLYLRTLLQQQFKVTVMLNKLWAMQHASGHVIKIQAPITASILPYPPTFPHLCSFGSLHSSVSAALADFHHPLSPTADQAYLPWPIMRHLLDMWGFLFKFTHSGSSGDLGEMAWCSQKLIREGPGWGLPQQRREQKDSEGQQRGSKVQECRGIRVQGN